MLKSHMDACENHLLAISKVPANSGHSLHKGTPREAFIKTFLESHLPSNVAIGTGEIIDSNSRPGQKRNQYDIVIYKRSYPKLDFGGGISGFLVESVIATIEVKSYLDKAEFTNAAIAARNSKALKPNTISSFQTGYVPPGIINIVVSYDGPANMRTIHGWICGVYSSNAIKIEDLPLDGTRRIQTGSGAIDAVFVLGRGFMHFDNLPFGFVDDKIRAANPSMRWVMADTTSGNMLMLFLMLQGATANIEGKWLNAIPYLSTFQVAGIQWGA